MSRYIDAENVLKELCETCEHEKFCKEHKGSRCTEYCIIANEPTADVAPVVHAHWIFNEKTTLFDCSQCGGSMVRKYPNCPWCRSKMDEEVKQ